MNTPNIIKKYLRSSNGQPIGVLLASKGADGVISIGWSKVHAKDHFNKHLGYKIALDRMEKGSSVPVPFTVREQVSSFVEHAQFWFRSSVVRTFSYAEQGSSVKVGGND